MFRIVSLMLLSCMAVSLFGTSCSRKARTNAETAVTETAGIRVAVSSLLTPPVADLATLTASMEVIAIGHIKQTSSFLVKERPDHTYTIYQFEVDQYLKGRQPASLLRIMHFAGPLEPGVWVEDEEYRQILESGGHYVLFLHKSKYSQTQYTELHGDEYVMSGRDGAVMLLDGQAVPHTPDTPIGKALAAMKPSEKEFIDMVVQAVTKAETSGHNQ